MLEGAKMFELFGLIVFAVFVAVLIVRHIVQGNVFVLGRSNKREYAMYGGYLLFLYAIVCNLIPQIKLPFDGYLFDLVVLRAAGCGVCVIGLFGMILCVAMMGRSFRVGIDEDTNDDLITTGIYRYSRNPMYVLMFAISVGEFLMMPTPLLLLVAVGTGINLHLQVLREEVFLETHYGAAYTEYRKRTRRYL
jgi:protein-S-isoprenylcysteine O-methyltransferase Ste14